MPENSCRRLTGGCFQEQYLFGVRGKVWAEGEVELQSSWIRSFKDFGSSDIGWLLEVIQGGIKPLYLAGKSNLCTSIADAASREGVPLDG